MKKRMRRSRSRGAAMVEAAVVVPVLVACWLAGVYAERACSAKLDAVATARAEAWGYASANCGEAGDSNPSHPGGASGAKGETTSAAGFVRSLAAGAGGGLATTFLQLGAHVIDGMFPRSLGEDTRVAQGPGNPGIQSAHSSQMAVTCNEPPFNGNVAGFAKQIFTTVVGR